jgi:hypothetical protein
VRGGSDREESGGRPAKKKGDRARQQRSDPAEVSLYVAVAVELSVALGGECAGEEDPEEKEDDPADLARERGLRRPIVPVPARAW